MNKEKVAYFTTLFYSTLQQLHLDGRYSHLIGDEYILRFLEESFIEILSDERIEHLMLALKIHDETSFIHSFDVMLLGGIANYYGSVKDPLFMKGCFLHDIGKLFVPAQILQKNDKPTTEEFEIIKEHTTFGYQILQDLGLTYESGLAKSHHEKLNGKGYPANLFADEINSDVRMLSILDVYSALSLERPYKLAYTNEEAFDIMQRDNESLDLEMLELFIEQVNEQNTRLFM